MGDVWLPVENEPVFVPPDGFRPPRWLGKGERKHIPESHWLWETIIERTAGRDADALYHPGLAYSEIERIEMETVREGHEVKGKRKVHVRYYWRFMGYIIGASKGKATEYVYVNYASEGAVHGYPITLDGLREKGIRP